MSNISGTKLIPHKNTNVKKRPSSCPKMSALKSGEIRKIRPSLHSQFFENAGWISIPSAFSQFQLGKARTSEFRRHNKEV
jgi:hypothetical protein